MGAMGLDSTLNIAHQACAKYSTLNKIAHVNCAKTGDMEIAHVNVLEIAHHFSLCISTVSSTEKCALQHTKSPKESLVGKV